MSETAMSVAMKRAGYPSSESRLYVEAVRAIQSHEGASRAVAPFVRVLEANPELLEALALRYLIEIATDMRGLTPIPGREATDFVPNSGHRNPASLAGEPSSTPGEAITWLPNGQSLTASPGVDTKPPTDRVARAKPRIAPRPPRNIEVMIAAKTAVAVSVMRTMAVRGRGAWADIHIGELRAIVEEGTRDSRIAKYLLKQVPIGTSTTRTVAETLTENDFQRAVQQASEAVEQELSDVE